MMSGDDEDRGEPLCIDVQRFLANKASAEAAGVAMDLIARVWWPLKTPFVFDEEALAARLAKELPTRGYTAQMLWRRRKKIASFFTVLPTDDGRRAPNISA